MQKKMDTQSLTHPAYLIQWEPELFALEQNNLHPDLVCLLRPTARKRSEPYSDSAGAHVGFKSL